jgi:hypothetical protein
MKIPNSKLTGRGRAPKHGQAGMISLIFVILLGIMMMLVMVETSSVIRLHREVKLLEQQQLKHLNGMSTNTVATPAQP